VSQMEAVLTAQKGQSYILHGPPGTGKSQTITNIIADALYRGKKVLFVAAKKAALDVVHKRLEQIGLAPFSLELHSNKSKKSDVLAQLARTLETAKLSATVDFEQEARRLDTARKQVSDYVNLLHQKQHWGWSLYDSITALEEYHEQMVKPQPIPDHIVQATDAQRWQQWQDWLPVFQSIAGNIIHPKENPLSALRLTNYTAALQESIGVQVQQLLTVLPGYEQAVLVLAAAIQFPFPLQTKTRQDQFVAVAQAVKTLPDMPLTLVQYLADKDNYEAYENWHKHFKNYQQALKNITGEYNRDILSAGITNLEMQWKQAAQSWFLPKWWNKRKVKRQLSIYKNTAITNEGEILQLFQQHRQLKEEQSILQQDSYLTVQRALKNLYKEEQTDTIDIDLKATMVQRISAILLPFGRPALQQWINGLQQQSLHYTDDIKGIQPALWQQVFEAATQTGQVLQQYEQVTGTTIYTGDNWLADTTTGLQYLQEHLPRLKDWMNYIQQVNAGKALQLDWLISAFENGNCTADTITTCCQYSFHQAAAQMVIAGQESLSLFNAGIFESKIEQYKKIAKEFQQLTIQNLRIKLAAQLPNTTIEAMQSSEPGILQRAIRNRGRGMSIRRLFDQLPTLLPRLAPCMLMSPISVAQYFDVDTSHFDLVIFDEASQLPTCEAVSALARARQAVIVGDPKQMPPTSFFSTNKTEEEDAEIEDLESILDDCLSLSIPSKYLLRHYRSKHESLIAFSNASYYENKLLTFPSADDLNRKVKYHHVPGHYDKGKTRTNSFEADAIVQYLQQHYADPVKRKRSAGVVTFSQTQQSLVEDKLQALFMKDPQLEQWANETAEPLFIKNLENVQGDERDIILFSIGYAPDQQGKMTMNFGPLNRNGGWRRLNVAVTRARYEMHVFATLTADQVDLNRTAAEGVAGLKAFLQFAQNGHLAFRAQDIQINTQHLSAAIAQRLQEKGLQVQCNIGTSGFKIDIGIIHPHKAQQYILGIVVDGTYYYNARTTNDREMVMPGVLKALGWNLHRVWTMDWYENKDAIIDRITAKVQQLLEAPETAADDIPSEPVSPTLPDAITIIPAAEPVILTKKQQPYRVHALSKLPGADSEAMYEARHRDRIKQQIQMLVDMEGPISKNWLYKKILQAWNTSRTGNRLEAHLQGIIKEMNLAQTLHHQVFYWSGQPTVMEYYRNNETEKRTIEDIAPEEIIVALQEVVTHNLSIEEEELIRYLCRSFGFAKVGKQIDALLRYAIDVAIKEGKIKKEEGRIKITG
jgi:very-short-patch-repair endonuclease